mgnify:CR=1 FL=1
MKKYKLKKKYNRALKKCSKFLLIIFIIFLLNAFLNKTYIESVEYVDNNVIITFSKDNISCLISNDKPEKNDNWVMSKNKKCILDYEFGYNDIYIKKSFGIVKATKNKIYYFDSINKDTIYLAVGAEKQYISTLLGDSNKLKYNISNNDVINVSSSGEIVALKEGTSKIVVSYEDISFTSNVVVTSLITNDILKNDFDFSKPELECGYYSKDDNDLLDKILIDRINDVGYKTRAGAVEAARFLVLEFPYKISYFYENGRQTTNNVDGEGRYYHEGLYLHESRYNDLTGSYMGPKIWGCPLYSEPAGRNIDNGLDCSGYISWALLNAGFDVKDVGAGFSGPLDLTDYGDVERFTNSLIKSKKIKVGDLVHSEHSGGHIGMIIGIDNDYFYVAQALWNDADHKLTKKDPNVMAVQITKYSYSEIVNIFPHVILMDEYYVEDGNLTNMW